jgi:Tfp pilus assembly protein PilF
MTRRDITDTMPDEAELDQEMTTRVQEGKQALEKGDIKGALVAFEKVVNHFPQRPEGHNNLGALYAALGESQRAEQCFDRVLDILPQQPNVLYNRGIVRARQGDHSGAAADFLQAAELHPDDGDAWNNLGVSLFAQGQIEAAETHFRTALELQPENRNAILNLSDAEASLGQRARAIRGLRSYLGRHDDPEVRCKLVELMVEGCSEALAEAAREAEALLASARDDHELRALMGRLVRARDTLQLRAREASAGN